MTKKEWRRVYLEVVGSDLYRNEIWKENSGYLQGLVEIDNATIIRWFEHKEYEKMNTLVCCDAPQACSPCKPMSIVCDDSFNKPMSIVYDYYFNHMINPPLVAKEEKDTTMYPTSKTLPTVTDLTINMAPAASASVSSKSDVQIQREHLLGRLRGIEDAYSWGRKHDELREAFNLDADNTPKTARQLIAAVKEGKFKLDDRIADLQDKGNHYDPVSDDYIQTPFAALTFDGPTPDKDGFTKARETIQTMIKDTKDTIIVKSPEDGLTAIQALEAWTPTGKAN